MTAADEARTPSALETVEALKRDVTLTTHCDPRFLYLGSKAHDAVLKCLQGIYGGTQSMSRLTAKGQPTKLIQVAGLRVCEYPKLAPWLILVTVERLWTK